MSTARKDLERLLFRSRELDSTKAAEVARGIFFNHRLRALGEELQRLSALVLSEADKMEGQAAKTEDIGSRGEPSDMVSWTGANSGEIGYTGLEDPPPSPPRPSGPKKRYTMKGFDWWTRFIEERNSPQ